MTIQDYINQNLPFYHITPSSNIYSILRNGLSAKTCNAICVIRCDNHDIWREIIHGQLDPSDDYTIIMLTPQKHNIESCMVAPDSAEEDGTGPLHNYIVKPNIRIDEDDIVEWHFHRGSRPDYASISYLVVPLENYELAPIPNVSVLSNITTLQM